MSFNQCKSTDETAFRVMKMQRVDENALDPPDGAPLELPDPTADRLADTVSLDEVEKRGGKDKEADASHKQEKPDSEEAEQKKSKTIITLISDNIKAISVALTHLILIGALVGFIAVIINEFRSSAVLLDQIEVPELLQKKGITAAAVSQRLLDEISAHPARLWREFVSPEVTGACLDARA